MKKSIELVPNIEKLFGTRDENLQIMEEGLSVTIELKADSVQIEGAARDYGVIAHGDPPEIDLAATETLRAKLRTSRKPLPAVAWEPAA